MSLNSIISPGAGRPRRRSAPTAIEPSTRAPWTIRVQEDFLDARTNPIKRHHLVMLMILEGTCRVRAWSLFGNAKLAARYGCSPRHLQTILAEMEREGLIVRVLDDQARADRIGIILRKRSDPTLPVADSAEALDRAYRELCEPAPDDSPELLPGAVDSAPRALWTAPPGRCGQRPPGRCGQRPKYESLSKNDELENDAADSIPRRRPDDDPPRPEPPGHPDGEALAAAAPVPVPAEALRFAAPGPDSAEAFEARRRAMIASLTSRRPPPDASTVESPLTRGDRIDTHQTHQTHPAQAVVESPPAPAPAPGPADSHRPDPGPIAILDRLDSEQRARFAAWPEARRGEAIARLGGRFDPVVFADLVEKLAPPKGPPMPDESAPLVDLIGALPGRWGRTIAPKLADRIMTELADRGGGQSFGYWHRVCFEVAHGHRPVEGLLDPVVKTLDAMARGLPIGNPAGYAVEGVKNWVREHAPS